MTEPGIRMIDSVAPPEDAAIQQWVGKSAHQYWKRVAVLIEQAYPGVFDPEWLFGGKKHGWSLRYKKNKSFCTFIPEKNRFALLIVFGAEERAKVEALKPGLSPRTQRAYDEATTYHDGKWLLLIIDEDRAVDDAMRLLSAKRRPKHDDAL